MIDPESYNRMSKKFKSMSTDFTLSKVAKISFSGKTMRFDRRGNLHIVEEFDTGYEKEGDE